MDKTTTAPKANEKKTAAGTTAASTNTEKAAAPKKHVPVVEILKAQYGIEGATHDARATLGELGIKLNRRKISNQLIGADPAPGKVKSLALSYSIDGQVHDVVLSEGEVLKLEIPVTAEAAVA